jgi:outer membrane protein
MKVLLFVVFCLGLTPVFGQQGLKFGHINTDEVFKAMPEAAVVEKQLDEEYKKQETQLNALQEQMKVKQDEYVKIAKTLTPEQAAEKEQELGEFNQRIQNFYTLAQQQLQSKQRELQAPLVKKLETAIQEVGDENGFIYIFEEKSGLPVYHSDKSIDVAPLVKAKLGIK